MSVRPFLLLLVLCVQFTLRSPLAVPLSVPGVDARLAAALDDYRQGRLEQSGRLLGELLPELRSGKDLNRLGEALNVLSLIANSLGDYEKAVAYASEAVNLRHESKDAAGEAASLNNLGLAHLYLGDYSLALQHYQKALEIDRRLKDGESEILRLNNIANVHYVRGSYSAALSLYLEALEKVEGAKNTDWANRERYRTQANLAVLYQKLGQNERALALYQEMLQQPGGLGGDEEARILTNIGVLYRHLGDPVKALDAYQRARSQFGRWRHLAGEIGALRNVGILQSASLGDHEAAVKTFSEAIELAQKSGNSRTEMQTRLYRAEAERLTGNLAAAQSDFEGSLARARSLGAVEEEWKSLFGLGKVAQTQGRTQEARKLFESSAGRVESLRARLNLSSMRPGFLADKRSVYDALIASSLEEASGNHQRPTGPAATKQAGAVFHLMEAARARTFQDSLGQSIEVIQNRRAPATAKRLKELRRQLTSLWARQLTAPTSDSPDLLQEYNRLENEHTRVEEELRRALPLGSARSPDLGTVQHSLKEAGIDLLIEYWLGDGYMAWVWATPAESGIGSGPAPKPDALGRCLASISDPKQDAWRSSCREVSPLLLKPFLQGSRSPARRIAVVPDGMLQLLPFETIEMPDGRLLVEAASLNYLPSAAFLLGRESGPRWSRRAPWARSLNALGDPVAAKTRSQKSFEEWAPLPHSREEVRAIADLLPGRKSLHLGPDARKDKLPWTSDQSAPILHLATHGVIDLENPDRSRVILSGTSETGPFDYLFLREIPDLDLSQTQLVTLSACETSRGKLVGAEGIQDFSRVLMLAGARVTVTSLWRVSDEATAQLMQQFYYQVSKGESVSDALREAKSRFLNSKSRFQHPAYWAAFIATGEAGVPVEIPVSWGVATSGLLVVCLCLAGAGLILSRRHRRRDPERDRAQEAQ